MGEYNPHAPQILGQEWAPIREEDTLLSPAVNVVELGHGFTFDAAQQVSDARIYINDLDVASDRGQTLMSAIYAAGAEDQSGPIERVLIPVNFVAVSGGTVSGAASALEALLTESSASGISLDVTQPVVGLLMSFGVSDYITLTDKRILGVNLLIGASGTDDILGPERIVSTSSILMQTAFGLNNSSNPRALFGRLVNNAIVDTVKFGEINQFWTANSPNATADRMPWTFTQLQRLDATATKLFVALSSGTNLGTTANSSLYVFYVALEVLFCEEKRLAVGATQFGTSFSGPSFGASSIMGANKILLHSLTGSLNPIVPAGTYVVTVSSADVGGLNNNQAGNTSDYPELNALRELYSIPTHPGVEVDIPFPMDETAVGDVFTSITTHVLPQISVHASGGAAFLEPHVYGRQAVAQVYGTINAAQEIDVTPLVGVSTPFPHGRYYARRFGDTTVPLRFSLSPTFFSDLTPADFDELPEILDGWKEINVRFDPIPSVGGAGTFLVFWDAANETEGNRWEILGAIAPALSGIQGNLLNQVPSVQRLGPATYGQPVSGAAWNLSWVPGYVPLTNTSASDPSADAVVYLAQDMPTITGFGISLQSLAVTGIGQQCGIDPCCIPTSILYNQLTWTPSGIFDNFNRAPVSSGWGTAISGQAWTNFGGSASDYSVNGSSGLISLGSINVGRQVFIDPGVSVDTDVTVTVTTPAIASGNNNGALIQGRRADQNNYYWAQVVFDASGTIDFQIGKLVAGVFTTLTQALNIFGYGPGTSVKIRLQVFKTMVKGKIWPASEAEPSGWTLEATDTDLTTGTGNGIRANLSAGNTNTLPVILQFDDFTASPFVNHSFGAIELQRMDTVEPDWKTIMRSSFEIGSFRDYEARIGVRTSYRVRNVNVYDFAGLWSTTVSGFTPAPGASGGCISQGHILIFTSNERQNGSINLAYSSAWLDQRVEEDFSFPEVGFVQLQLMYNKDFYTAFRPLERGGERFNRTVLVQAGAIAPETLADFTGLRDMAWDTVNYICVRDEDGNRWFATVLVPSGRVLRDRRLYLAPVEIIEVTDTPTPVDPYA